MLSWLGMIFSGLGLLLQIKDQVEFRSKTMPICKQAVDKLRFMKDINSFYQEMYFKDYQNYFKTFGQKQSGDKNNWELIQANHEYRFRKYGLDASMPAELAEDYKSSYTGRDIEEVKQIIVNIGVDDNIKVLNISYPGLFKYIEELDELLLQYTWNLEDTGGGLPNMHNHMDKLFHNILFYADRSLKELIEVLYKIMVMDIKTGSGLKRVWGPFV